MAGNKTNSDNDSLYQQASTLAEAEETSFSLGTYFNNFRDSMRGTKPMYDLFEFADERNPQFAAKGSLNKQYLDGLKPVEPTNYAVVDGIRKTSNDMQELFKEAGYDFSTPEKMTAFSNQVLNAPDSQAVLQTMENKVNETLEAKTPEQLEGKSYVKLDKAAQLYVDPSYFRNVLGYGEERHLTGEASDILAFTPAQRQNLIENGVSASYRLNQPAKIPRAMYPEGAVSYLNVETANLRFGMETKTNKAHSKVVAGVIVAVTAASFLFKHYELSFRSYNEQKIAFAERVASLESDYFPTEQSIHDHFRMKEWFYRTYRTMYGEAPEDDDDDDEDDEELL